MDDADIFICPPPFDFYTSLFFFIFFIGLKIVFVEYKPHVKKKKVGFRKIEACITVNTASLSVLAQTTRKTHNLISALQLTNFF